MNRGRGIPVSVVTAYPLAGLLGLFVGERDTICWLRCMTSLRISSELTLPSASESSVSTSMTPRGALTACRACPTWDVEGMKGPFAPAPALDDWVACVRGRGGTEVEFCVQTNQWVGR